LDGWRNLRLRLQLHLALAAQAGEKERASEGSARRGGGRHRVEQGARAASERATRRICRLPADGEMQRPLMA
jgi:hypothetical protein